MAYEKILVAVDLGASSAHLLTTAQKLKANPEAELHVLHAVEPLNVTYGADIPMDLSTIQDEIYEQASDQLRQYCNSFDIQESRCHLVIGRPEVEIPAVAGRLGVDVIAIGSHARYGLALLLGSTTDGVLHHAGCDVLAVYVDAESDSV